LLGPPGIGVDQLQRHAVVPQDVLIPLEHALGAVHVLLAIRLERLPDLFERQRHAGLQEKANQVQQPFERLHPVLSRHRAAS
jgi:hypothetical protein